ncbi:DUF4302 domain-containing protein [Algibacter sp. L3A6]|uniref:DUF4302 domain-containing protein n=1 Tax=Algibacter sp. L3A6 TaxID=2686366 RepID=UPI00131E16C3|nr:DUF4302 domain-containing protein [Algibacter sp. L3A6]
MKKLNKLLASLGVFILLLVVTSCSENEVEPLFDQSINERTDALTSEYVDVLTAPENGWIGYYSPNANFGAYTMLIDFETNGDVTVDSDYEAGAYNNTLTYRLGKTLKIELVFESTSAFSEIFSLYNNNNGGEFVFNILSATEDEVVLESKLDYGDDVTILTLNRASVEDLDLTNIYASVTNIATNFTESSFRNVLLNDETIASFDFDSESRIATISYFDENGDFQSITSPIVITAEGFYFLNEVEVNGTLLTSFVFDEDDLIYVNDADGLKIVYQDIPGPLKPYDFGLDGNGRYNYLELEKSSTKFNNFWLDEQWEFYVGTGYVYYTSTYYLRDLDSSLSYIQFYIADGATGDLAYTVWYDFTYEIKEDGKVYFTLTGDTNASAEDDALLVDLIEVILGSESGYYIADTGGLLAYSNGTFSLINADEPTYNTNYYDF